jgi:hypothetical protein
LQTCSSIWACPVCSAIIRQRRAERIEAGAVSWTAQEGRWLAFLTLTVRHGQFDTLEALYAGLAAAWKSLRESRWWRQLGWDGFWRSVEVTYGANGWHPHLHLLLFGHGEADLGAIGRELAPRWRAAVEKVGLRPTTLARGSRLQAVNVGGESLAQYLSKVLDEHGRPWSPAAELARADMKLGGKGLSPFQILELARDGEKKWLARWYEYERVTRGRRCIESSRGLAELVGVAEVEDEDLVAEDEYGEAVLLLHRSEYRLIADAGYASRVLDVAEERDGPATVRFVEALLRVVST